MTAPETLHGVGAAPGRGRGPVWVAGEGITPAPPPGCILVASVVHPYMAPLLLRAAGVVAEDGGVLQHAAILAREFGIPAVVGIPDAVARLAGAELVEVDGATGEVTVLRTAGGRHQK